ncbi:MAG: exopolyphosphatase [Chitinophagales bacterium]|nr:MAG: exopolyphosphatase [Chitinophagales bacterium]
MPDTNPLSLTRQLTAARKVVITTHANPDGDAMGSSLAMFHYLKKKGCVPAVIVPTSYPDFLAWLPGNEQVLVYQNGGGKADQLIAEAEIIVCLDFNALSRTGDMENALRSASALKAVIDHHISPDTFPDFLISDVAKSSTAEIVYDFITVCGDEGLIDKEIAECLFTGILTDTGGFQFPTTTAAVHRKAAFLIECGADNHAIYERVFNTFSEMRLRLFGYCIERMKLFKDLKTALIVLSRNELQRFAVRQGDTEGLVNFPMKMQEINLSVLIVDRTERIKLSFRSRGTFDVNQFAREHFNGGGHRNAAGGYSFESLEKVVQKFESILPQYREALQY